MRHPKWHIYEKIDFSIFCISGQFETIPGQEIQLRIEKNTSETWKITKNIEKLRKCQKTEKVTWECVSGHPGHHNSIFLLCWRSKSKSLRLRKKVGCAFLICFVSRKGGVVYNKGNCKPNPIEWPFGRCSEIKIYIKNKSRSRVRCCQYICSTSLPGGNQVDGLPPASSHRLS